MQYSNSHLIEVNCSFQFNKESTPWDNTFFGRFYEKISKVGFLDKEDRKGMQVTFGFQNNVMLSPATQVEDQVVFKNENGRAILMSKNKISFHVLSNYTVWEDFVESFIQPFSEIYKSLDLGNGVRECSLVYLNRFTKAKDENLSEYFKIVAPHDKSLGRDVNSNYQRVIDNGTNFLIAKFNSQFQNDIYNINFECGAVNIDEIAKNSSDWIQQANETHKPVNDFFESIITDKLREVLK